MRLLETTPSPIPKLREFIGSQIPRYAILSHTWGTDEATLQELTSPLLPNYPTITGAPGLLQQKAGFKKIQETCALARQRDRLEYAWVDTCCIDKTSSAEVTEAINSMFAWYRDAEVCYVYLEDLEHGDERELVEALPRCRWFTRGWTLQELIAPRHVLFFDKGWNYRGNKRNLAKLISGISGVPEAVLRQEAELCEFAVARRMSWAARRETTRTEDLAYCLLGIFDVNLSLIYGEGIKAFGRLQTAIVQSHPDLSIFAWTDDRVPCPQYAGMLAESPRQFSGCGDIEVIPGDSAYHNFAITTRGIQTEASLLHNAYSRSPLSHVILQTLCYSRGEMVGVSVRKIGGGLYARFCPDTYIQLGSDPRNVILLGYTRSLVETLTLATRLPPRHPFHPSADPVLGNRWSALRIDWRPIAINSVQRYPRSHWDDHDQVFFACTSATKGWCTLIVNGSMPLGKGCYEHVPIKLFLGCYIWNFGQAKVMLEDLESVTPATTILLTSHLQHIGFESCLKAQSLVEGMFADAPGDRVIERSKEGVVSYPRQSSRLRMVMGDLKVLVRKEAQPSICVNPVTVIEFAFPDSGTAVVPEG